MKETTFLHEPEWKLTFLGKPKSGRSLPKETEKMPAKRRNGKEPDTVVVGRRGRKMPSLRATQDEQ